MQRASRTISFDRLTSATQCQQYDTFLANSELANVSNPICTDRVNYNLYYNFTDNTYPQSSTTTPGTNNFCDRSPEVQHPPYSQCTTVVVAGERRQTNESIIDRDSNARDSITIALEEIEAIVDGGKFDVLSLEHIDRNTVESNLQTYPLKCNSNKQTGDHNKYYTAEPRTNGSLNSSIKQEKQSVKAPSRLGSRSNNGGSLEFGEIYESLKRSIIEFDASDATMATDNGNANNNSRHYDLFNRCATDALNGIPSTETKPYVEIIEQPAKCALRFRYKCEGRSAGSLPGVNSTAENKTYPTIKINNYVGRAVVVISCVTKDAPYKAHPHNIVGKEGCKKGICTIVLDNSGNQNEETGGDNNLTGPESSTSITRSFNGLGIQCVKRRDIEESLSLRESINVDPFRNGFSHKMDASNIDLNAVRLCFQVFIEGSTPKKCDIPLTPIVSEPIHDKKAMSDLVITKLSHCSAPATGGREIILLCDRISKDDVQVRFFEERDGKLVWETYSDISPADVHKQVAICLRTPKYYNEHITHPVMARVQLRRISDNQVSEPRLFQFLPCESDEDIISRKRQKIEWVNMNHYALDNILQHTGSQHQPIQQTHLQHQQQSQFQTTQQQPPTSSQLHQQTPHPSQ